VRYLRPVWRIGCCDLQNQLDAVFETASGLAEALDQMTALKARDPAKHVWASGDFYDVVTRRTESGEVGFLVCPTVEFGREPPATCLPYSASKLLEVVSVGTEILPAEDYCSSCNEARRGRYANRDARCQPFFLCSTCERWSETLPSVPRPGRRSRLSGFTD